MNLHDLLANGNEYVAKNRPKNPDMNRIMEIVLHMKALTAEAKSPEEHEAKWREHVESFVDFDALGWQALNMAFDVFGVRTAHDYFDLIRTPEAYKYFITSMQAFYDGFLLGAEFERKGGHRDG